MKFRKLSINRIVGLILVMTMVVTSFSGCGKEEEDDSKDCLYLQESVDVEGFNLGYNTKIFVANDEYILYGYSSDMDKETFDYCALSKDMKVLRQYSIPIDGRNHDKQPVIDKNGNVYLSLKSPVNRFLLMDSYTDEVADTSMASEGSYDEMSEEPQEMFYELVCISKDGEIIGDKDISEYVEGKNSTEDEYDSAIRNMVCDEQNIYLFADSKSLTFDMGANFVTSTKVGSFKDYFEHSYSSTIVRKDDIYYIRYEGNGGYSKLGIFNPKTGKVSNEKECIQDMQWREFYTGMDYDFMIANGNNLYGCKFGDEKMTKIIDCMASNIMTNEIETASQIAPLTYLVIYKSFEDDSMQLAKFTKTDASVIGMRTVLKIATVMKNSDLEKAAMKFNKNNNEYNISIVNYDALYGSGQGNEYFGADASVIEKLNTDIISGKVPDMILLDKSIPIRTYIGKGIIEDLEPIIAEDPDINAEDYNQNIVDACRINGKQYTLVPGFSIKTMMVKKDKLDGLTKWDSGQCLELFKKSGIESFFPESDRNQALEMFLEMTISQYVDWETGECSFDNEEFRNMIKLVELCPEEFKYDDSYFENMGKFFRNDLAFAKPCATMDNMILSGNTNYIYIYEGDFNSEGVCIGFPTKSGCGSVISPSMQLAMSSKSKHKDVCWNFMKTFLLEEYQSEEANGEWNNVYPIMNSVYDEYVKGLLDKPVYDWGEGNVEPMTFYAGSTPIEMEALTEEDVDKFNAFVNSIDKVDDCDPQIYNIIHEEITDYFEGKATLDEVCVRIQSRVQIYIYESL